MKAVLFSGDCLIICLKVYCHSYQKAVRIASDERFANIFATRLIAQIFAVFLVVGDTKKVDRLSWV